MTFNTNPLGNHVTSVSTMVDSPTVQSAANEGAFELVPGFCLMAPALREAVDSMADSAMVGLERITQAIANAPAEMQPLLNDLRALFCLIGHGADSTSDDIGTDIAVVWGMTQ